MYKSHFLLIGVICLVAMTAAADVWYVDKSNDCGTEDGLAWATAFTTIQAAINAAQMYGEVWVAEGVYDEVRTSVMHDPPEDTGSLVMKDGVHLYGGFAGTELDRLERAAGVYSTIDGSSARSGAPAYHVVVAADNVTLDGFRITGGRAFHDDKRALYEYETGAGMCIVDACATVRNCVFEGNEAKRNGAGIYVSGGSIDLDGCWFVNNTAEGDGAGMYTSGSSLTLSDCVFSNNTGCDGGGVYVVDSASSSHVNGCVFKSNVATNSGGGLTSRGTFLIVENSQFVGNYAKRSGGGWTSIWDNVSVLNCLFAGNATSDYGAALMFVNQSIGQVANCTLWGNTAAIGASAYVSGICEVLFTNCISWGNSSEIEPDPTAAVVVAYCDVQGGYAGEGNIDAYPRFVDSLNGDFRLYWDSPCIDAGDLEHTPEADLLGVPRPQFGGVDMGAYEFVLEDDDGDGAHDPWELDYGFNPEDPGDGAGDPDQDGVPNHQEFLARSDPFDGSDPPAGLWVSVAGDDVLGDGTSGNPWATIGRAMTRAAKYSLYRAVTVYAAEGVYDEAVAFAPNVTIQGDGRDLTVIQHYDASDDEHIVVTGAEGAALRDCAVTLPGFHTMSTVLLRVDDVAMLVDNVLFDGNDNLYSLGALVTGVGSSDSVVQDSLFRRLHFGIQAVNSGVNITRTEFEGIRGDAVFVRLPDVVKAGEPLVAPLLGDADRVITTGWNRFRNVYGPFVLNMSPVVTQAENNDWGVYTEDEIAEKMSGIVDFTPFVGGAENEEECHFGCCATSSDSPAGGNEARADATVMALGFALLWVAGCATRRAGRPRR